MQLLLGPETEQNEPDKERGAGYADVSVKERFSGTRQDPDHRKQHHNKRPDCKEHHDHVEDEQGRAVDREPHSLGRNNRPVDREEDDSDGETAEEDSEEDHDTPFHAQALELRVLCEHENLQTVTFCVPLFVIHDKILRRNLKMSEQANANSLAAVGVYSSSLKHSLPYKQWLLKHEMSSLYESHSLKHCQCLKNDLHRRGCLH